MLRTYSQQMNQDQEFSDKISQLLQELQHSQSYPKEITWSQALQSNNFMNAYIAQEQHKRRSTNFAHACEAARKAKAAQSLNFKQAYAAEQEILDLIL